MLQSERSGHNRTIPPERVKSAERVSCPEILITSLPFPGPRVVSYTSGWRRLGWERVTGYSVSLSLPRLSVVSQVFTGKRRC